MGMLDAIRNEVKGMVITMRRKEGDIKTQDF